MDWDAAVEQGCDIYSHRMHNICCDNCHSHVVQCLNLMAYDGKKSYNMVQLAVWFFFTGREPIPVKLHTPSQITHSQSNFPAKLHFPSETTHSQWNHTLTVKSTSQNFQPNYTLSVKPSHHHPSHHHPSITLSAAGCSPCLLSQDLLSVIVRWWLLSCLFFYSSRSLYLLLH